VTGNQKVHWVSATTGEYQQTFSTDGDIRSTPAFSSRGNSFFVCAQDGKLYKFRVDAGGAPEWSNDACGATDTATQPSVAVIPSGEAGLVDHGAVAVASASGHVKLIREGDGVTLLSFCAAPDKISDSTCDVPSGTVGAPLLSSIAYDAGGKQLLVPGLKATLFAVSLNTTHPTTGRVTTAQESGYGTELWRYQIREADVALNEEVALVMPSGVLVMSGGDGRLHLVGAMPYWGDSTWRVSVDADVPDGIDRNRTRHDVLKAARERIAVNLSMAADVTIASERILVPVVRRDAGSSRRTGSAPSRVTIVVWLDTQAEAAAVQRALATPAMHLFLADALGVASLTVASEPLARSPASGAITIPRPSPPPPPPAPPPPPPPAQPPATPPPGAGCARDEECLGQNCTYDACRCSSQRFCISDDPDPDAGMPAWQVR
jgi:hypothetical protein